MDQGMAPDADHGDSDSGLNGLRFEIGNLKIADSGFRIPKAEKNVVFNIADREGSP